MLAKAISVGISICRMLKTILLFVVLTCNLKAATYLIDDFSSGYLNGNLAGQNGWLQTGATATTPIQINNNKVTFTSSGQDIYKALTSTVNLVDGATLFTRIDFSITSAQNTGDMFFHLSNPLGTSSNFYQRLNIRNSAGGFNLGIMSTGGTNSAVTWGSSLLNYNTRYTAVIAWNKVPGSFNDTFNVYLNPTETDRSLLSSEVNANWLSTSISDISTLPSVNIRQGTASSAPAGEIYYIALADSLGEVGIIPEPSSFSLLGLGITAILCMEILRRRNE